MIFKVQMKTLSAEQTLSLSDHIAQWFRENRAIEYEEKAVIMLSVSDNEVSIHQSKIELRLDEDKDKLDFILATRTDEVEYPSTRTRNVAIYTSYTLGHLARLVYNKKIRTFRNCGQKTINELMSVLVAKGIDLSKPIPSAGLVEREILLDCWIETLLGNAHVFGEKIEVFKKVWPKVGDFARDDLYRIAERLPGVTSNQLPFYLGSMETVRIALHEMGL
jgi:hypothetical protein